MPPAQNDRAVSTPDDESSSKPRKNGRLLSFPLIRILLVSFVAIIVRLVVPNDHDDAAIDACPNVDDLLFRNNDNDGVADPSCYFSQTYREARSKFRRLAISAGAESTSLDVVPEEDLTIDVAVLRGRGSGGLVVHTSGVHGVEGFSGSAVQCAFLHQRALSRAQKKDDDEPTVVLVHAMNPHGMAHLRRFNENNVDLNRNAVDPEVFAELLARDPNMVSYEDLRPLLNPEGPPTLWSVWITLPFLALRSVARHGYVAVKRAIVTGQYHDPEGLFYGGDRLQRSHEVLLRDLLLRLRSPDEDGLRRRRRPVTWIDVHTGLGPSGRDTLLVRESDEEETARSFPGAHAVQSSSSATSSTDAGSGYGDQRGFVSELYDASLFDDDDDDDALFVTQEFGTRSSLLVARALVLEHQDWRARKRGETRRLEDDVDGDRWSGLVRDAFDVRAPEWRRRVLDRGSRLLEQAAVRSRGAGRPRR